MSRFIRLFYITWLIALFSCAWAAAPAPGAPAFTIDLPTNGVPLPEIGRTLVAVATARTWTVKENIEGKIVIQLIHRKVDAIVTYSYSAQKIQAFCEAYQVDSKGNHGKPEYPARWLKYLEDDLRRMLGSAPSAALKPGAGDSAKKKP